MDLHLKGKNAVILGGTRGIGPCDRGHVGDGGRQRRHLRPATPIR